MKQQSSGLKIVLNRGQRELQSATVQVGWSFSEEVIAKAPKYILAFEQTEAEQRAGFRQSSAGRRYAAKVEEGTMFVPFLRPGKHRVAFLALGGDHVSPLAAAYLRRERRDDYDRSIHWAQAESGKYEYDPTVVAATVVEVEIPEALFVRKPETAIGKVLWWAANLGFESKPVDQCKYHGRLLWAPLKLIGVGIVYMFGFLLGVLYALYVLVAWLTVLFFGYRPENLFSEMWDALKVERAPNAPIRAAGRLGYRQWARYPPTYMAVTPVEIVLIVCCTGVILWTASQPGVAAFLLGAAMLAIALGVVLVLVMRLLRHTGWIKYFQRKQKPKPEPDWEAIRRAREAAYLEYLRVYFDSSKPASKLEPFEESRIVVRFKVAFESLKAKVCKPYSS